MIDAIRRMSGDVDSTTKTATPTVCVEKDGCTTTAALLPGDLVTDTLEFISTAVADAVSNVTNVTEVAKSLPAS